MSQSSFLYTVVIPSNMSSKHWKWHWQIDLFINADTLFNLLRQCPCTLNFILSKVHVRSCISEGSLTG